MSAADDTTLAEALQNTGAPPSLANLTSIQVLMRRHQHVPLYWFHHSFNALYGQTIAGEDLTSLLSPTTNAFVPDCLTRIRSLMKTSYRAAASLTDEENLIAIDRFIANTAIFIKRTNNRYTPVRSSTVLTQVGLEIL